MSKIRNYKIALNGESLNKSSVMSTYRKKSGLSKIMAAETTGLEPRRGTAALDLPLDETISQEHTLKSRKASHSMFHKKVSEPLNSVKLAPLEASVHS